MDELEKSMRKCLANTFVMYFKTHGFHWNVEGINFPQYHKFLNDLYDDLYGAVDPLAEEIRALGFYAPRGLNELYADADIVDSDIKGDNVRDMLVALLSDNTRVTACLLESFGIAAKLNQQGLCNFLADRIDTHKKHGWMLTASLKGI